MDLQERNESIGGSGYGFGGGAGGYGWILMAIFLVVLFAWWGRGQQGGLGDHAALANTMGEFHPRENCADKLTWSRFSNFVDPTLASIERQQAVDTGAIQSSIDLQTSAIQLSQERTTNAVIFNQNQIAREQETRYFTDKLNEARDANLELQNKLVALEAAREADRRQQEILTTINGQFCSVNNRITAIEGDMLKAAPCYVNTSPAATFQCGPRSSCCS